MPAGPTSQIEKIRKNHFNECLCYLPNKFIVEFNIISQNKENL